ncbi:hypothetical protein M9H77_31469 [Catharanthus roseus]|uniref:Uncharacterized protein n=1 Tax=Catharanthus roseus TaxID=4058 RepID=A0ACC0A067_CATRO|nr:hypothetical protein M9H77_31469 [Catharanthus roseus]
MDSESDERFGLEKRHGKRIKITHEAECSSSTLNSDPLPFNFLPFELNIEILLRLPVKSLSKFKCVSKSWLSFIASPQFIEAHLSASSENGECANHKLIFTILPPNAGLKVCSLSSVVSEPSTKVFKVNYPMKRRRKSVWVVGYCQGLVCYAIEEKKLILWNPSTAMYKKLPDLNVKLKNGCYVLYGFGYDKKNKDYKVVAIFCVFCSAGVYETEVKIYSLKTNSWRRTQDFKGGIPLDDSGKYANGKLHWTASRSFSSGNGYEWKIISLDLADETYGEVNRPDYGDGTNDWLFGVLDGCLSVLCNYQRTRGDLWVMKEYGSHESWTKLVSIPYVNSPVNSTYSMPLYMLKNGEILLIFGTTLVVYNPKQNSFRYPQLNNLTTFFEVSVYVESLVSPNSFDGTERQHQ